VARALTGLVVLVASVLPIPASAAPPRSKCPLPPTDLCTDYVWRGRRWGAQPIPYFINPANAPAGAEQDIHDAFLAWQNEAGSPQVEAAYPGDQSTVSFGYQGPTTATGGRDGINTVHFTPCTATCGAAGASIAISSGRVKRIVEFDIGINPNWGWATDVTCPSADCGLFDLQNAVTHEIGHALDLYHPLDEAAAELTMYGQTHANEVNKRDLGAGEVLALRRIYPA
jgi:hypothetical protein